MSDNIYVYEPSKQVDECKKDCENEVATPIPEETVNTDDFSSRDLQLFVDSLETIARLEKAKYQRRLSLKIKEHEESFEKSKHIITCLDDDGDDSHSNFTAEYTYAETCYNVIPQKPQTSNLYCNITSDTLKTINSESEESGVFCNNTTQATEEPTYEDINAVSPIRQRTTVITQPKNKSLKSRLISMIVKKQYIQPYAPSADLSCSTTYGEVLEESTIYDRVVDDALHQQFTNNTSINKAKSRMRCFKNSMKSDKSSQAEEKFVNKAMRHLTL